MAKRSVDDILKETLPHKSKEDYLKAWKQFKEYIGEDRRPNEEDYIQYFDCLRGIKIEIWLFLSNFFVFLIYHFDKKYLKTFF